MDHLLPVKVVPASSRDRVAARYGDGIKVQTSAPPEAGKANAAVTKILAQFLGLKPAQVELVSAPANPRKQFRISGLSAAQLAEKDAPVRARGEKAPSRIVEFDALNNPEGSLLPKSAFTLETSGWCWRGAQRPNEQRPVPLSSPETGPRRSAAQFRRSPTRTG